MNKTAHFPSSAMNEQLEALVSLFGHTSEPSGLSIHFTLFLKALAEAQNHLVGLAGWLIVVGVASTTCHQRHLLLLLLMMMLLLCF
jgi:hypothetical protein